MMNNSLRSIACLAAMLSLGVASFPGAQAAQAAQAERVAPAPASIGHANAVSTPVAAAAATQTGRGWGSMIACAGCAIGAGFILAGGPGAILIAVNTPGSSIALLGCVATCYEALAT